MLKLNELTMLLLILHFIGDYHLQTEKMAQEKQTSPRGMLRHGLIMAALHLILWIYLVWQGQGKAVTLVIVTLVISHLAIDFLKNIALKSRFKDLVILYLVDQALHLAVIFWLAPSIDLVIALPKAFLTWTLLFIIITKPANITFKILFAKYQWFPEAIHPASDRTEPGAGALIGNLERIISGIFLAAGQYAAIGLIYTAKSIARFKKIEENQRFAEYYLIGTLYSILYILASYFLLF